MMILNILIFTALHQDVANISLSELPNISDTRPEEVALKGMYG